MNLEDEHAALKPDDASSTGSNPSQVVESASPQRPETFFREQPPQVIEVAPQVLLHWTPRDVLRSEWVR
jgi:hypothetical protein